MLKSDHEVRLKSLSWHQKIVRNGIFVFLILLSLQTQGIDASESEQSRSYLDSTWSVYESIKSKFYGIYTAVTSSNHPLKSDLIDSGLTLLKIHHDPFGAEAICKAAVKESPNEIDAWICLGESQLILHNNAWSRNNKGSFVFQKLSDAMYCFNQAMSMDATNARVRLNLGLTMYLTAIRDTSYDTEEVSQVLFDAVNHFQAAASLSSPLDSAEFDMEKDRLHIASMYNVGLAYLALGDPSSSIPFFRKVASVTNNRSDLTVATINLSTAIAQKGRYHDSFDELHKLSLDFCHFDHHTKDLDLDEVSEAKMMKLCSLIRNNLGQAPAKYIAIAEPNIEIPETSSNNPHRTYSITSDSTHTESNPEEKDTMNLAPSHDDAIIALETALKKDSRNVHLWITLSKAKLRNGDQESAIKSAISALNLASNTDEVNKASDALDSALSFDDRNSRPKDISDNIPNDASHNVQFLKYEQQLLSLKAQILENSWVHSVSPGSSQTPTNEVLSHSEITNDPSVIISGISSNADDQSISIDTKSNEHEIDLKSEATQDMDESIVSDTTLIQVDLNILKVAEQEKDAKDIIHSDKAEISPGNSESKREIEASQLLTDKTIMNISKSEFHNKTSSQIGPSVRNDSTIDDISNQEMIYNTVKESKEFEIEESKHNVSEQSLVLQPLFQPDIIVPDDVCQTSLSYMKMADAYMQNENFKAASKQFLKVLKKTAYSHIPALLGYATSLERLDSPNTAVAYANVTHQALIQDMKPLAAASLQRAITSAQNMNTEKLKTLRHLLTLCFTTKFAADVQFEIGQELIKISAESDEIVDAFMRTNAYSTLDGGPIHASSLLELAKIAFANERYESSREYIDAAITQDLGSRQVEALVYLGRVKEILADSEGAMAAFKNAIELPVSDGSADAHYYFGLYLKAKGSNEEDVKWHIERALNLGLGLTPEATEILGEHNMSVIKSAHRAEWQRYQDMGKQEEQRGGIMSGGNISGNSIFSTQESSNSEDTLTMLEQGAASYDGSYIPMGNSEETGSKVNPALSRSKAA